MTPTPDLVAQEHLLKHIFQVLSAKALDRELQKLPPSKMGKARKRLSWTCTGDINSHSYQNEEEKGSNVKL